MATAVICEFNPFHNGHKYLLKRTKEITDEPIIAIMSGSFTQRGEIAVTDKFSRTRTALKNGADLVIELPVVYAVSGAQRFAFGGISVAKAFDCVKNLAFGCEIDNIEILYNAANSAKNLHVQSIINRDMKNGGYYPRAVESAVREVLGDETADVLKTPNNILAVEYIRCLENSDIRPVPIKREGVSHDSTVTNGDFASASQIRNLLRQNKSADRFMPETISNITFPENLERAVLYKLRGMSEGDFASLPDVNEGLENRIYNVVRDFNSIKEIIDSIKTKRYTHSRIRRIITCAFLGITEELQNTPIEYVRVLGFTKSGAELLKSCSCNIVTSPSAGMRLGANTYKLLSKDIYASDVAALAYKKPILSGSDYTTPIIKI